MASVRNTFAITNTHVVPIEGDPYDGTVVVADGRISAVGPKAKPPRRADVIDAEGGWVLPGFVDAHTHVGVWNEGEGWSGQDTNEMTDPVTAQVRAPSTTGTYSAALALPDPSASLAGTPAYAVQLANPGAWDATTGRNSLSRTLTVTR